MCMDVEDRKRVTIRKTKSGFASHEQRAGFGLFAIVGSLALFLGVFYLVRQLNQPFFLHYEGPKFLTSEERRVAEIETQKSTDTDGDGLVDYDELNIHGTSPYLMDTDGDGYSDATEIIAGKDPTCAEGKTCEGSLYDSTAPGTNVPVDLFQYVQGVNQNATTSVVELQQAVKDLNVEQIRALLIESGADEVVVSALSDEELTVLYQSVITEMEANGELNALLEDSVNQNSATTP